MPILARLTMAIIFAIGAMFVFILVAHQMVEGSTIHFDKAAVHYFQAYHDTPLHTVMTDISWAAGKNGMPLTVLGCLIFLTCTRRFWPDGVTLLFGTAGGLALIVGLKALFQRPRPFEIFTKLGYSFPSGHSFFALTVYGMMAYWLTQKASHRKRVVVWGLTPIAIFLVGFSRVFLGEHYPSDVAAGYAVALPWLWGCLAVPTAFHRQQQTQGLSLEERRARYELGRTRLKEAAVFLPNLVKLVARLVKDPRVPFARKLGLMFLAAYLAMPFDLIPDFIPVIGVADDVILAGVILRWVVKAVPAEVVREHWDGKTDIFTLLQQVQEGVRSLLKPT